MSCQASDWKNLFVVAHEAMNLAYGERKRRRPLLSSVARAILFLVRYSLGFSAGMPKIKASRPFYPRYLNYEGKADSFQISRDPTPCIAETALAMVNLEVGLDYSLRT